MKIRGHTDHARPGRTARVTYGPPSTRSGRVGVLASVAALLSAGLLALTGPAGAAPSTLTAQNGEIAFTSARSGHYEVYLAEADGIEPPVNVTGGMVGYSPDLSSDGEKVAFTGRLDGKEKIFVANTDGSGAPTNVIGTMSGHSPVLSPDGSKVAFVSYLDGKREVYVANTDGSESPVHVTFANGAADYQPVFSPDGEKIAYTSLSERDGDEEVHVADAGGDGGVATNVSDNHAADDNHPEFSPDGGKVVFVSDRDGNQEIYVGDVDDAGGPPINISKNARDDASPDFSPDGEKVAFVGGHGSYDVYTANADGSGLPTNITNNQAGNAGAPDFSPDGNKVVFESDWLNELDVYVANVDGSGIPVDITDQGYSLEPDWGGVSDAADTTKPTVVPVSPTSGTTDATPLIKATVRDTPVNPFRSGVRLFVDGKKATGLSYDRASGKLSHRSEKLKVGKHQVRIEAKDAADNATTESWSFAVRKRN